MFFESEKVINWKLHDQKLAEEMKEWADIENKAFKRNNSLGSAPQTPAINKNGKPWGL